MKQVFAAIASWLILAGAASAHSFNVTMIVPAGEAGAAMQAFLIASAERDSHADETSNGHLGGVDAHVQFVEFRGDGQASLSETMISDPDIVVFVLPEQDLAVFDLGVWTFSVRAVSPAAAAAFLPGSTGFASDTGKRVYVAARLIDIAVRAQDGVDDVAALADAIRNY